MNENVKALLDAIAEWEKVDDLVKQYGWGKWVDDDNGNAVLIDEWWDGCRNNMIMLAAEVRNDMSLIANKKGTVKMDTEIKTYRPSLAFYRANAKGTGCAMKMELHPAHGDTAGCIMMSLASQKTVGDYRGPNPIYPTFDWENAICVKLDFIDLSKMFQVFRGECESIEDGRGLVHRSPKGLTYIRLAHLIDPIPGYKLEVKFSAVAGSVEQRTVMLAPCEALGLTAAIESSLGVICFGVPE